MASSKSRFFIALGFLAPPIGSVFLLRLWPAALAVRDSFQVPGGGHGLDNYIYIFTDQEFLDSLKITAIYSIIVNPLQMAIARALAVLMTAAIPTIRVWR